MAQSSLKGLPSGSGRVGSQVVFPQVGIIDGPIVREGIAFGGAGSAGGSVFFKESMPTVQCA